MMMMGARCVPMPRGESVMEHVVSGLSDCCCVAAPSRGEGEWCATVESA